MLLKLLFIGVFKRRYITNISSMRLAVQLGRRVTSIGMNETPRIRQRPKVVMTNEDKRCVIVKANAILKKENSLPYFFINLSKSAGKKPITSGAKVSGMKGGYPLKKQPTISLTIPQAAPAKGETIIPTRIMGMFEMPIRITDVLSAGVIVMIRSKIIESAAIIAHIVRPRSR